MQASHPPATPTDYAARGAFNTPTVDVASPIPALDVADRGRPAGMLDQAVAIARRHPAQTFLIAVVAGWAIGAWTRRRNGPSDR
ncbi:hypothetical protein ASD86_23055 [Lysobacter sp. Root690]|nr:hypothetical protein ASD86_23055 [Lysobacter sp. Root690]